MADNSVADHEVAQMAYQMWIDAGKPDGMAEEHWHRAKEMLEARAAFTDGPAEKPAPKKRAAPRAKKPAAPKPSPAPAAAKAAAAKPAAKSATPAKPRAPRKPKAE